MPRETVPGHNHSLPTPPFFFGLGQSSTRLLWHPRVWAIPPPSITLCSQTALSKVTFVATCGVCGSMLNLPAKSGATMLLFLSFNREPARPASLPLLQADCGSKLDLPTNPGSAWRPISLRSDSCIIRSMPTSGRWILSLTCVLLCFPHGLCVMRETDVDIWRFQ